MASSSVTGPDLGSAGHDPDRLLADYLAAGAAETGYDELVEASGEIRAGWRDLVDLIGERGRDGLDRLREVVRGLVDNDGISYIEIDRDGETVTDRDGIAVPGRWNLDGIPLLLSASDWREVKRTHCSPLFVESSHLRHSQYNCLA